jgi:uncharacterized protein DUF4202
MEAEQLECAERKIRVLLGRSRVPEESGHAFNTLEWVLRLKPDADSALRLAAIAHDIERGDETGRVSRNDYTDFDEYKAAHAARSAELVVEILRECGLESEFIADVGHLVLCHETGGTERSDILKWADSISYFDNNLAQYARRHTNKETRHRVEWGLKRLPPHLREAVVRLDYENTRLAELVETIAREME